MLRLHGDQAIKVWFFLVCVSNGGAEMQTRFFYDSQSSSLVIQTLFLQSLVSNNCWFYEAPSKAFLLFFLLSDWLNVNNLKSRIECGFSDIFSRHFCSTVAETIGLTNYKASFGAKKCSENHIWICWDDSRSMEPTNKLSNSLWITL